MKVLTYFNNAGFLYVYKVNSFPIEFSETLILEYT